MAAGTITFVQSTPGTVGRVQASWDTDATGTVPAATASVDSDGKKMRIVGDVVRVVFVNDAGAAAPNDTYSVKLNDEHGVDILNGAGAALSGSLSSINVVPFFPLSTGAAPESRVPWVNGQLTPVLSTTGSSAGGDIHIYTGRQG